MKTTVAKTILSISTKDRLYIEKINAAILSKPRFIAVAGYDSDKFFDIKELSGEMKINIHPTDDYLNNCCEPVIKRGFDVSNIGTSQEIVAVGCTSLVKIIKRKLNLDPKPYLISKWFY